VASLGFGFGLVDGLGMSGGEGGEGWIRERIHGAMVCESAPDDNQTSMHERYSPTHSERHSHLTNTFSDVDGVKRHLSHYLHF
jgi:hypothetical protein